MIKIIQLSLVFMLIFTGGCGIFKENRSGNIDASAMPETEAFKDEFTREFMASSDEVEEGFYSFESKTNGYTMLFPVNATISSTSYDSQEDFFETYNFGEGVKESNLSRYVTITYEDKPTTKNIEFNLDMLSEHAGYETSFEKIKNGENLIYYSKGSQTINDTETKKKADFYGYFGYIQSQKNEKGIQFFYEVTCMDAVQSCEINSKSEEENALLIMKSINFTK
ncbi:hypothetical protein RFW18_15030 [Metabacillus idriensis]|uniref:hypothetical protein n=1 Tax=Metabacillus idriensis TaxID=324768 RepID=UPI0028135D7A|nr:hypothetical protein [Metabacillus idriensis]MDR0139068.1 hypothetical protein [Metabacillus idriensis]